MIKAIRFYWLASDFAYPLVAPFEPKNEITFFLVPVLNNGIIVRYLWNINEAMRQKQLQEIKAW